MRLVTSGLTKLTMISIPVIIVIVLTLVLVLASLWVGSNPVEKGEAHATPAVITAPLSMRDGGQIAYMD